MRKQTIFILLLAGMILLAGCAPKVVGKRKHKKLRDCGCELLQNPTATQDSTTVCFAEL
jgi:hypothetical protein